MKFIALLIPLLFSNISEARPVKVNISAYSDYTGDNVDIVIGISKAQIKIRMDNKGRIGQMEISIWSNGVANRLHYYISFWEPKPREIEATLYKDDLVFARKIYTRKKDPELFKSLENLVKKLYEKYKLAELADKTCREHRNLIKDKEEKDRQDALERSKELPPPIPELEKVLKI